MTLKVFTQNFFKGLQLSRFRACIIFFALLVYFLSGIAPVGAKTIAVIPVEDLSKGVNSPNFELTSYLADELSARSMDIVSEDDVISFMAAERVRWLGYLETDQIIKAKNGLGADLILLGTVTQQRDKLSPTFGLSLQLIRTIDAKTIWSASGGLSLAEIQNLLRLNEPATLDELWPILVKNVMSEWPSDLGEKMVQALVFDIDSGELPPTLQIKGINLSPRYVRPGEMVKCAVHLEKGEEVVETPQVFLKVGSRIHLAQQSTEGLFYEASWTGSEIEKGIFREVGHEALKLAATELSPQLFEGVWPSLDEDDSYPVTLILNWPDGKRQIAYVGNYSVDSAPPETDMFITGKKLSDLVTFSDEILIVPKMKVREPTSHWRIHVENDTGRIILGDEGDGNLPKYFFWRGTGYSGRPAKDGIYRMVLKVWDRAGNDYETVREVRYKSDPPDLIVSVEKMEQHLRFSIDREDKEVPLAFWYVETWNEKGDLIKASDGKELPYVYDIPLPDDREIGQIEGIVAMKDVLGNQTRLVISDLYLLALQQEKDKEEEATETSELEKDSWSWIPNF